MSLTFGVTSVDPFVTSLNSGGYMYAWGPYSPAHDGTLTALGINITATGGTSGLMALYADSSGTPDGALIAQTAEALLTGGQQTFNTTTTPIIHAANAYWIVFFGQGPNVGGTNTSTGQSEYYQANTFGNPFPGTFSGTFASNNTTVDVFGVYSPSISIAPSTLPNGDVGTAYSQTLTAIGGTGPYTFAVSSGTLPTGLTLSSSLGTITGTPSTTTGSPFSFTVQATDSLSATGTQAYTVTINPAVTVTPSTLPNGDVGSVYNQSMTAAGGSGSYTWSLSMGSTLPPGVTLSSSTGVLHGTPTTIGTYNFSIRATDTLGGFGGAGGFNVTMNAPGQWLTTTLPNAYA